MTLTNKLLLWKYENKFNFNSVSPAVLFCDSHCIVYSLQRLDSSSENVCLASASKL